ncbi:stalk domain-containing protein [Thermoanaerobacter uzonensis]|uniref:stalk domain-containing protein n=1 Tax=Thermoanaerobacter uzonensis TaxID=447593 RepID=UPI003D769D8C
MIKKILSTILIFSITIFPVVAFADDDDDMAKTFANNDVSAYTQLIDNTTVNHSVYSQSSDDTTITQPSNVRSSDQEMILNEKDENNGENNDENNDSVTTQGNDEKTEKINSQIQKLKEQLQDALDKNQFEKALEISNKIKELEQKLKTLNQNNNMELQIAELKAKAINYLQNGQLDEAINTITKILKLQHSKDDYKILGKLYREAKKDKNPHVFVNGNELQSDVNPVIQNGKTYIPLRAVANAIGVDNKAINWDEHSQAVSIKTGNINIYMPINTTQIIVNGQTKTIDAPAVETNGRVMVPLRAISQLFGENVDWYQEGEIVTVGD